MGVLDAADGAVSRAKLLDARLGEIQALLAQDVNVTALDAELECLRPWLDGLPDVPALAGQVDAAQALLQGTVGPALRTLSEDVANLTAGVGTTAEPGSITIALESVTGARGTVTALIAQAEAFVSAAEGLPASVSASGAEDALRALRAAVQDLLTGAAGDAADYAAKVAALEALQTDLFTLQDAIETLRDVDAALDALIPAATSLVNDTLPALLEELDGVRAGYASVAPCASRLLDAATRINATVARLPAQLDTDVDLLKLLTSVLDELAGGNSTWLGELQGLVRGEGGSLDVHRIAGPAAELADSVLSGLGSMGNLSDLARSVGDVAAVMRAGESALRGLDGLIVTALAFYPQATSYTLVRVAATGVAGELRDGVLELGETSGAMFDAAAGAQGTVARLAADPSTLTDLVAEPDGSIPAARRAIAQVPLPASYAAEEARLLAQYASLPKPLGSLVDQAKQQIGSILGDTDEVERGVVGDGGWGLACFGFNG